MHRRFYLVLAVAFATIGFGVMGTSAQVIDMATHPYVGSWMCQIPGSSFGRGTISVHADGTTLGTGPLTSVGPDGKVALTSPSVGTWEPTGPRTAHGTSVFYFSDLAGAYTGSLTFDGSNTVNADGMTTFEEPGATVTIRDAQDNITAVLPGGGAVVGCVRIGVGAPGFPAASAAPGTSPSKTP
jgi:hypothetical protein